MAVKTLSSPAQRALLSPLTLFWSALVRIHTTPPAVQSLPISFPTTSCRSYIPHPILLFCFFFSFLFTHVQLTVSSYIQTLSSDVHSLQKTSSLRLTCSFTLPLYTLQSPVFKTTKSIKMQFSVAALAIMATGAMAGSTLYITEEVTITSCAPTVTVSCAEYQRNMIFD